MADCSMSRRTRRARRSMTLSPRAGAAVRVRLFKWFVDIGDLHRLGCHARNIIRNRKTSMARISYFGL